tara:strand:- start:243 stop:482 length:240 start_codon:yes stop_codon:yes gene_type:complete
MDLEERIELEVFIDYMLQCYDPKRNNWLYVIEGLTRERIIKAVAEYKNTYDTWASSVHCVDSVDRERVRDIIEGVEFRI